MDPNVCSNLPSKWEKIGSDIAAVLLGTHHWAANSSGWLDLMIFNQCLIQITIKSETKLENFEGMKEMQLSSH